MVDIRTVQWHANLLLDSSSVSGNPRARPAGRGILRQAVTASQLLCACGHPALKGVIQQLHTNRQATIHRSLETEAAQWQLA